ncbi:MAG TPA: TonB-dependent receptor [Gammaproteobacteria bacterium]|nr:TonB-dependent receptor [Gammaproteobacteria bacterium]
MSSNLISSIVRYALAGGVVLAVASPAVFAQNTSQSSNNQNSNSAQLGKIEVTGSRILRTNVETAQPITVITHKQIQETGLTSVGQVLQQLTQAGPALNTAVNNGGNGQTQIDLRYLGSSRVLVLVNGRRWIPGLGGAVDLNQIPVSIIDHVEILQDGASAIYGSDAIAGVVNIITIKNFNGAEANAYMGMYDGHGVGGGWDGKTQEYDFTIGSSGNHGGVVMNVSYVNQSPVWAGQRTMSAEPIWGEGAQTGSSGIPSGRFWLEGPVLGGQTFGQATCAPYNPPQSNGTCNMTLLTPGQTSQPVPINNFTNYTSADAYNYAPANYLVTPSERTGLYVQGHYNLADNLTFTTEVMYNRRDSQELLAAMPVFIGLASGQHANGLPIGIGASNPYNPFGIDLVGSRSQWCVVQNNCSTNPNELLFLSGRRMIEAGNRIYARNVATYMFRSGLNGYFNALGSEWDWDAGYSYGNNYETDITTGLFNTLNLAQALDAPGFTPCSQSPGCVPFNWFGGNPSITPAMLNYVLFEAHDVVENTMRDYTANITGNLAQLPAGPLGVALGAEYLEYDGFSHPDATTASGNTSGNVTQPTDGRQWTHAEYVEFNIPLVTDAPFMKSVSLDLANRWSQFSWKGGEPTSTNYGVMHHTGATTGRAALRWQTTNDLLLRASWSQGFRVPSLSDLYFGNSTSYPHATDPCAPGPNGSYSGTGPLPPGCNGVEHIQPNSQFQATVGGNPNLTPEKAISQSVGFVYNPSWLPGFDFSADYYKITLVNAVSAIGVETILNGCYVSQNQNYCKLITMQGTTVTNILDTNLNIGGERTSGIDMSSHYRLPSTRVGDFKLGLDWTFLRSFVETIPNSQSPTGFSNMEMVGTTTSVGGFPSQRANADVAWNYGNWSALWQIQYIDSMHEGCTPLTIKLGYCSDPTGYYAPTASMGTNYLGRTIYHNAQMTYHVDSWNADFTFGIRNIFDKQPPAALTAFGPSFLTELYPIPGRFFYARVGVKF